MRAEDQKKIAAHYGALCGLRSEAESDSDDSTMSGHSQLQELTTSSMPPNHCAARRPRPESLTLPFENRERESHLVSEEEFDRIIRQEELKNPLPPLPTGIECGTSGTGLRRSISTARNTGISMMSHRTREMSAEFNGIATSTSEQHNQDLSRTAPLPRGPTLTALPRASTSNDLLVYQTQAFPLLNGKIPSHAKFLRKDSATSKSDRLHGKENGDLAGQTEAQKRGHKRHFSAVDMFDSVKKRLRLQNTHDAEYEQARAAIGMPLSGSPARSMNAPHDGHSATSPHGHSHNDQNGKDRTSSSSTDSTHTQPNICPDGLKKSLLKRTWSKTKHTAKVSISSPLASSKFKASDPLTTSTPNANLGHGRDTPTPVPSTRTTATNNTSHSGYYVSAEPSPQNSQRSNTPTPMLSNASGSGSLHLQHCDYEFISGPAPRRGFWTKLGGPPSRNELNTMVARQQNRIVDLTLQNNVLVGQIELLRGEVQEMKVHGNGHTHSSSGSRQLGIVGVAPSLEESVPGAGLTPSEAVPDEESQCVFGAERPLSQEEIRDFSAGTTRRTPRHSRVSFDPDGWRKIVGVRREQKQEQQVDMDSDVDMGGIGAKDMNGNMDDKRKTWMTCDS